MTALTQRLFSVSDCPVLLQRLPSEKQAAAADWYIGDSDIQGQGVFAGRDFDAGEVIGVALTSGDEDDYGSKIWNLTLLAQKCNHQANNNVEIRKQSDQFDLVALKPIRQDEELVSSYYQVSRAIGPRSRMMWDGKDVPSSDLEDFVEKVRESDTHDEEDT